MLRKEFYLLLTIIPKIPKFVERKKEALFGASFFLVIIDILPFVI